MVSSGYKFGLQAGVAASQILDFTVKIVLKIWVAASQNHICSEYKFKIWQIWFWILPHLPLYRYITTKVFWILPHFNICHAFDKPLHLKYNICHDFAMLLTCFWHVFQVLHPQTTATSGGHRKLQTNKRASCALLKQTFCPPQWK